MDTSYLEKQVSTIINKLHELFDEIGVPSHERDSRESELFAALSETLHNQLKIVTNEKHLLAEQAEQMITTIKQMTTSLEGRAAQDHIGADLAITYPLKACLQDLKQRHQTVHKLHRERYEQVKKLAQAIDSYASHLEPSFVTVPLPPIEANSSCPPTFDLSHAYFETLDSEFTRVYEEYMRRLAAVKAISSDIINLWAELGTPQAQTDSHIVQLSRDCPEQLGLHQDDLAQLSARRDRLLDEKQAREKRLRAMRAQIEQLWERLCIPEEERKVFLASNRGCGMRILNEFEDELGRLNELKKQNLGLFVEETRIRLQNLWDELYFSEEEMLMFTPAFSDVYSDALLAAHEAEIERLECLKLQRQPILSLIDKHKSLIKDRDELSASSQDASRLMLRGQKGEKRDPTRLLREEKMRKRIAKDLPKIEAELQKTLVNYEQEYGRPFLVLGEDYLDEIAAAQARAPPPRSKTPSGHSRSQSQSQPKSATTTKTGTVRNAPQSALRSKTPTNFATIRGTTMSQASVSKSNTTSKGNVSPSRIPARAPLAATHGNKSPDRPYSTMGAKSKTMGPPRLPPPKMQDLFLPPQQQNTPTPYSRGGQTELLLERSASIVRQTQPDDPYDDAASAASSSMRTAAHYAPHGSGYHFAAGSNSSSTGASARSYASSSAASSVENHGSLHGSYHHQHHHLAHPHQHQHQHQQYQDSASAYSSNSSALEQRQYAHAPPPASRPQSRQISQQSDRSVASSCASGGAAAAAANGSLVSATSENWETFDEGGSEEGVCLPPGLSQQQQRYAGHVGAQVQKRALPDAAAASMWHGEVAGKRLRNGGLVG